MANWYDQTQDQQGAIAPTATNPVILDGSKPGYDQPIEITAAMSVASLTVQNAYANTLKIDKNATLTTNANDIINNACTLTVISLDVNGIALNNNNFTVAAGGTLNLRDLPGTTTGAGFLYAVQNKPGEYLNNAGTVSWIGTAGAAPGQQSVKDNLNEPVLNTGSFSADGGTGGIIQMVPATLAITGQDAKTNNVTFYQTAGTFALTNSAIVSVDHNYSQSGGSLTTGPTASGPTCKISATDINVAGGTVVVDTTANTYGTLTFDASTVEINGEVDLNGLTMMGGKSTKCDLLDCGTAKVTLGTSSFLNVGTTGGAPLGIGNQWIVMKYGSLVNAWGKITVPPTMASSVGATQILVSN